MSVPAYRQRHSWSFTTVPLCPINLRAELQGHYTLCCYCLDSEPRTDENWQINVRYTGNERIFKDNLVNATICLSQYILDPEKREIEQLTSFTDSCTNFLTCCFTFPCFSIPFFYRRHQRKKQVDNLMTRIWNRVMTDIGRQADSEVDRRIASSKRTAPSSFGGVAVQPNGSILLSPEMAAAFLAAQQQPRAAAWETTPLMHQQG